MEKTDTNLLAFEYHFAKSICNVRFHGFVAKSLLRANLRNFHRNVPLSFYEKSVKSIYLPPPYPTKVQYYCFHEIFSEFYFTVCKCTVYVRVKMKNLLSPKDFVKSSI